MSSKQQASYTFTVMQSHTDQMFAKKFQHQCDAMWHKTQAVTWMNKQMKWALYYLAYEVNEYGLAVSIELYSIPKFNLSVIDYNILASDHIYLALFIFFCSDDFNFISLPYWLSTQYEIPTLSFFVFHINDCHKLLWWILSTKTDVAYTFHFHNIRFYSDTVITELLK